MTSLEDLKPGLQLQGVVPQQLVTIVDVKWHGTAAVELTYKRAERQKRLMVLGDRIKKNPNETQAIYELVGFLEDPESSLRWLAGSALKILASSQVVQALAEFLEQDQGETGRRKGFNEQTVRTVSENSRTLGFDQQEFSKH